MHGHTREQSLSTRLHKGKSPVREMYTCTDTHENNPCLPDCTRANRRSGRRTHAWTNTRTTPCPPDCTRANHRSGRCTHARTHTRTTPAHQTAQGQITGQGDAHMHGHTREQSLPTRLHKGKSPVRETHMHGHIREQPLPTRPHKGKSLVRGDVHMHRHTQQQPVPTRLHKGKSPVREIQQSSISRTSKMVTLVWKCMVNLGLLRLLILPTADQMIAKWQALPRQRHLLEKIDLQPRPSLQVLCDKTGGGCSWNWWAIAHVTCSYYSGMVLGPRTPQISGTKNPPKYSKLLFPRA